MISIAIDGPSGAGKSTIAKAAAKKFKFIYLDTGALYRAVALYILRNGIGTKDEQSISGVLDKIKIELEYRDSTQLVLLNGVDVSGDIRENEVSMAASDVSAFPAVRKFLLDLQRNIAEKDNVIMDGRDIGTVVLPKAQIKIFLTATPEDRAERRVQQLESLNQKVDYDTILSEIKRRDYNDINRDISPLKQADDAIFLDTTGNELSKSIEIIIDTIEKKLTVISENSEE